jgi:hypothetical protein
MGRQVREIKDLVIDEISLVDKGANQHATVTIAKRHGEEDKMDEFYDDEGYLIDTDSLSDGDIVYDGEGEAWVFEEDGIDVDEEMLETVGKRWAGPTHYTYADGLREELSKALTDNDRDEIIAKAFSQIDYISAAAEEAGYAAEVERQLRLEREYIEVAKNYEVAIDPEILGPVLMRVAETMSHEDCYVIAKALESATGFAEGYFEEIGNQGYGSNSDIYDEIEGLVDNEVSKRSDVTREEMIAGVFETNPEAYNQYMAERYYH